VYVVDASDHARLAESREALHGLLARPELQDVPLLILANKQDAGEALTPHEVESRFDLQQMLATGQPQSVLGCTALNGDGVQEGACWLADVLKERARGESGAARVAIARDLGMGRPSPARSFALRGAAE
jgi:signal recognition particle receptor subunit beta